MKYVITNNELYHYGIKGMKWGVRKSPEYTKDQISQRRKQLIAQAPKSDGKRRLSSDPPTKGYWRNASDSQIKRLMISEDREKRKTEKDQYKYAQGISNMMYNLSGSRANRSYSKMQKIDKKYKKRYGEDSVTMTGMRMENGKKYVKLLFKNSDNVYLVDDNMIIKTTKDTYDKVRSKG